MALSSSAAWEVRPTNGLDTNPGYFAVAGPTYATDLAATVANTAAPVCTSATYNFVAGDVGAYLYIKSGTNWYPQLYKIASVAANAATLSAACASTASPTSGTWAVDYSNQSASAFSGTDLVVDGALNTKVTSATHTFTQADVGNGICVSAGASWNTGVYQINSVAAGAATLDRSPAAVGVTGGTWALGGAKQTIPSVMTAWSTNGSGGNKCFVKAEATIVTTATITLNAPGVNAPSRTAMPNRLIGYTSSRTDRGQVTIQLSTNSSLTALQHTTFGWLIENFIIDCNNLTGSRGIDGSAQGSFHTVVNCSIKNFKTAGVDSSVGGNRNLYVDCEFTGGGSAATAAMRIMGAASGALRCYVHDNTCPGIVCANNDAFVHFCLITNNSGASSDGIQAQTAGGITIQLLNNTIYQNGRHGINVDAEPSQTLIRNNLLVKNGGYGLTDTNGAGQPALTIYDGNAFWSNTSGARNNMDDGAAQTTPTNFVNLVAPYVNTLDVTLTNDPFVNAAGNDYRLNSNPGGGAACRAAGTPTTFLNGTATQIGALDMGCLQHADPRKVRHRLGVRN